MNNTVDINELEEFGEFLDKFRVIMADTHETIMTTLRGPIGISSKKVDENIEEINTKLNTILKTWDEIANECHQHIKQTTLEFMKESAKIDKSLTS